MLIRLYNLLWVAVLPAVVGWMGLQRLQAGKYRHNLTARLGLAAPPRPNSSNKKRPLWVHALSVGEVLSAIPLIQALKVKFPHRPLVVTTSTEAGQELARSRLANLECAFGYLPLDAGWMSRRFLRSVNPAALVLVETDLWPNLLRQAREMGIPVILVNGRLSDRSLRGYLRIKRFVGPMLQDLQMIGVQSREDGERFQLLGARPEQVVVTGNLKFDHLPELPAAEERLQLLATLGWRPQGPIWLAGSTHPGEEKAILQAFMALRRRWADLVLILAPRNPERFGEVSAMAAATGLQVLNRSRLAAGMSTGDIDILVLDTIGELARFYSLANFAFIGGSLVPKGGHNPLEAACRGVPVVFGPHMENFRTIAKVLLESGGAVQVQKKNHLVAAIGGWLQRPHLARAQGEKGRQVLGRHRGAVKRSVALVEKAWAAGRG